MASVHKHLRNVNGGHAELLCVAALTRLELGCNRLTDLRLSSTRMMCGPLCLFQPAALRQRVKQPPASRPIRHIWAEV